VLGLDVCCHIDFIQDWLCCHTCGSKSIAGLHFGFCTLPLKAMALLLLAGLPPVDLLAMTDFYFPVSGLLELLELAEVLSAGSEMNRPMLHFVSQLLRDSPC
jgi:hypothetical protein